MAPASIADRPLAGDEEGGKGERGRLWVCPPATAGITMQESFASVLQKRRPSFL
jgi:hypothetical protein